MRKFLLLTAAGLSLATAPALADTVLVTALQGEVTLEASGVAKLHSSLSCGCAKATS